MEDKRIQMTILELNEECDEHVNIQYVNTNPSLFTAMALPFIILHNNMLKCKHSGWCL